MSSAVKKRSRHGSGRRAPKVFRGNSRDTVKAWTCKDADPLSSNNYRDTAVKTEEEKASA
jgi:hypothetical protein